MIQVKNLSCSRDNTVLCAKINFEMHERDVLQISGANGAGKTTLLKTIAGLLPLHCGVIKWRETSKLYIGHQNNLHDLLTPLQNLEFLCALNSADVTAKQMHDALSYWDLIRKINVPCAELSAGQKQKVSLARLNLITAKFWLLDEPLANLDDAGKESFENLSKQHLQDNGAIMLASHQKLNLAPFENQVLSLESYA